MTYSDLKKLKIECVDRVAWVTIDNPPVNLFDLALITEMSMAGQMLADDDEVGAVVIQSADPDFFIAHADVNLIQDIASGDPSEDPEASFFHQMTEHFRLMPKATIGKIDGIARGGGLELLAALDMRFCSLENAVFAQPEVAGGIIPGGGGSARWPRLIGHGRAMELILCGHDFDGATAEKYGIVNRAVPAANLDGLVANVATAAAAAPLHVAKLAKHVAQCPGPVEEALAIEHRAFLKSARSADAQSRLSAFMEAGGQTREFELETNIS